MVWSYFEEICKIPRPSKKEEKIAAWLMEFAKKHQLEARQDEAGNVLITKPATPGKEQTPGVVLQAHMDMVCEKRLDVEHDFTPEGLKTAFDRYGVDAVMVGRASIGAPWIFREMKHYLLHGTAIEIPASEKMALLRRQIAESIEGIDELRGILHIRRHLAASPLFKGIPNFRETRIAMLQAKTWAELDDVLQRIETDYLHI